MSKHTLVRENLAQDCRTALRRLLVHCAITTIMARSVMKSEVKGKGIDRIRSLANGVFSRLVYFRDSIRDILPEGHIDGYILDGVTEGLDPEGDVVNNIGEVADYIATSKEDYTKRINFAFKKDWQDEILWHYFEAGGGTREEFDKFHSKEKKRQGMLIK